MLPGLERGRGWGWGEEPPPCIRCHVCYRSTLHRSSGMGQWAEFIGLSWGDHITRRSSRQHEGEEGAVSGS